MILGLGVDIVEVSRLKTLIKKSSFIEKIFSSEEAAYCRSKNNPEIHFAARFAAKEAVMKGLGTGFSKGISFKDIEVRVSVEGEPSIHLTGKASELASQKKINSVLLSLSHETQYAVAVALLQS